LTQLGAVHQRGQEPHWGAAIPGGLLGWRREYWDRFIRDERHFEAAAGKLLRSMHIDHRDKEE